MTWFFIALISPLLYAFTNHIDKYLISKYLHESKVGALIIFSALFGIVALPVILFFQPAVLAVSLWQGIVLAIIGILVVLSVLLYLYALQNDEATFVVPFYQTIPVFGFIFAYFILGETLSGQQIIASFAVLLGALILSFDLNGEKIRFKGKVVGLMLSASLFYAMGDVLFKLVALERGFWISAFWTITGKVFIGVIFFIFIVSYRNQFIKVLKEAGKKIVGLNFLNETLALAADLVVQYAVLLAPVALVLLVNGFQPLFVFIIGVALTLFLPRISQEILSKKIVLQKIIGIAIIIVGSIFIV